MSHPAARREEVESEVVLFGRKRLAVSEIHLLFKGFRGNASAARGLESFKRDFYDVFVVSVHGF